MAAPAYGWRRFLLHYANEHVDFRIAELKSILKLIGVKVKINEKHLEKQNPFLVVHLPSEECARQIMKRTVLIRSIYELWTQASSQGELSQNLHLIEKSFTGPYLTTSMTFRIVVEGFNRKIPMQEKIKKIESLPLDELGFGSKVKLKDPDQSFYLLEYYGPEGTAALSKPRDIYFGRWIAAGQRSKIQDYHLKNRHFIGNTSMDACLSFIMANMGLAGENKLVLDPFVGTGSLLVACAHFGSYVAGTDIDYLLLHGKARPSRHNQKRRQPDESIQANLHQYGKEHLYLDVFVADSSKQMWRPQPLFDAIITDPPYGVREPAKKVGTLTKDCQLTENDKLGHIPEKVHYQLSDIFKDLLNFAAQCLTLRGRLVYWFPVYTSDYEDDNIPTHPCLELIANSEQQLSSKVSRRLITMEKVKDFQVDNRDVDGATITVDHYANGSFRNKYFDMHLKHVSETAITHS